jgi:hypothetical protein
MVLPRFSGEILLLLVVLGASLMFCNIPPDPADPSNTKIAPIIQSEDGTQYKETLWDTIGKTVTIGATLYLPGNFDTIYLTVSRDNHNVFDTSFSDFSDDMLFDTLWKSFTFLIPGNYRATFTPKTSLSLDPVSISFVMLVSENHQPDIEIAGNTTVKPGQTCVLSIKYTDPDSGQILTPSIKGQPDCSTFLNNTFFWPVPSIFSGKDTVEFIVTDNGNPPLSTVKRVIIMVSADTVNSAPVWSVDTLTATINDTSTFIIQLASKCTDIDGDSLTYLLLQRTPVTDSIKNDVYTFRATPLAAGTHFPAIVAVDPQGASDTLIIKLTIQQSLTSAVELASIGFSSGTLREKSAPVPDTLYDTVSFNDSLITISVTLWNSGTSININGNLLPDDSKAAIVRLSPGTNTVPLILKAFDNSKNKTYFLIIIRKQNSVEPLTTPPAGLKIDNVFAIRVSIRWDDLSKATTYTVQRSKQTAANYTIAGTVNSNSFTDTGLEQGAAYFYRVNASNAAGFTDYSTAVSCTTLVSPTIVLQPHDTNAAIGKPTTLVCSVLGTSVQIQWRKNGIDLPDKTNTTLTFASIVAADTGVYTIKAWNSADSAVSQPFMLGILPETPDGVVAIARSAFSTGISWNSAEAASGYILIRSVSTGGTVIPVCTTTTRSYIDTMLSEGTTYLYRVIAANVYGYSDTSVTSEVKTWEGPKITRDLEASLVIAEGKTMKLSVTATGLPECTYQWKKNDLELPGANLSEYVIDPAYQTNSGIYLVIVKNSVRTITSKQIKVDVSPVYTLNTATLPVTGGSVTRSKDTAAYISGSAVTLTAVPATGYRFSGWSDDTTATANPVGIVMSKNKVITANFIKQYSLTLTSSSSTRGAVEPSTSVAIDSGIAFTIKATPTSGYKFKTWSTGSAGVVFGDLMAASTTVKLNSGDATVQGVFGCVTFKKQLRLSQYPDLSLMDAVQTEDGGYLVISSDQTMVKLNGQGDTTWTKHVYTSRLKTIYKANDNYMISGTSYNESQGSWKSRIEIEWYAQNGNSLGSYYLTNDTTYNTCYIAIPANDGGYICGGQIGANFHFVKFDANRNTLWEKEYTSWGGAMYDCRPTRDGGYILVGPAGQGAAGMVYKIDNTGNVEWHDDFDTTIFSRYGMNGFYSVDTTIDGKCVIAGGGQLNGGRGYIIKLSLTKNVEKFVEYSNATTIQNIKTTKTGDLFMVGSTISLGNGGTDIYLIKTNGSGDVISQAVYGTFNDDYGISLKTTNDGGCIVVGSDNWIIKTDENCMAE